MKNQKTPAPARTARIELAKTLKEQSKTRIELAKTRRELVKTRAEQARTRAEFAKARRKKTEIRPALVEKTLQRVVHKEFDIHDRRQTILTTPPGDLAGQKNVMERLSHRQREVLRLIAISRNTKQIASSLNVSPKTIEYHRSKLMKALKVHDVPGLVRFALRMGLVPLEA